MNEHRLEDWEQDVLATLNKSFGNIFRTSASYRYYAPSKPANASRKQDRYFYTVRKCFHKGGERYLSGIYRYNASKQQWKATKKAGHAKKHDAIARARKLSLANS